MWLPFQGPPASWPSDAPLSLVDVDESALVWEFRRKKLALVFRLLDSLLVSENERDRPAEVFSG